MSASVVVSTFDQSIFATCASFTDMVAIASRFARAAERDDADAALRECREEDAAFDFARRVDADFAIVFSPSSHSSRTPAVEHSRGGVKRQSPFAGGRTLRSALDYDEGRATMERTMNKHKASNNVRLREMGFDAGSRGASRGYPARFVCARSKLLRNRGSAGPGTADLWRTCHKKMARSPPKFPA